MPRLELWSLGFGHWSFRPPPSRTDSYVAADVIRAYVELLTVSKTLADMPLFLDSEHYIDIDVPLEATYAQAWRGVPARWREVIEGSR